MKTSISIVSMGLFLLVYSANGEEQVVREDDKAFHEACYPWERIPIDKIADKQRISFEGDAEPEGIPLAWVVDLSDLQNQVRTKIPSQSEFSVHRIGDITGKMYVDVTTNDAPSLGDVCKMYFSDSRNLYYALPDGPLFIKGSAPWESTEHIAISGTISDSANNGASFRMSILLPGYHVEDIPDFLVASNGRYLASIPVFSHYRIFPRDKNGNAAFSTPRLRSDGVLGVILSTEDGRCVTNSPPLVSKGKIRYEMNFVFPEGNRIP